MPFSFARRLLLEYGWCQSFGAGGWNNFVHHSQPIADHQRGIDKALLLANQMVGASSVHRGYLTDGLGQGNKLHPLSRDGLLAGDGGANLSQALDYVLSHPFSEVRKFFR